jgi:hypothetical protein
MPEYYYEYDSANRVFASRVTGAFTDAVFENWYHTTAGRVRQFAPRAAILDLTTCRQFDLSTAAVRKMAGLHPILPDPAPRFVVAPNDIAFGMARMFQMLGPEGRDMLFIVRALDAAYEALGLTAPAFERLPDIS